MRKINITELEEQIIKNAIRNVDILYDFNINNKEFEESYGYTKEEINRAIRNLMEKLL